MALLPYVLICMHLFRLYCFVLLPSIVNLILYAICHNQLNSLLQVILLRSYRPAVANVLGRGGVKWVSMTGSDGGRDICPDLT